MNHYPHQYHHQSMCPPPPQPQWFPALPPNPPPSSAFWQHSTNLQDRLKELQYNLTLAKSIEKELEILMAAKNASGSAQDGDMATDNNEIEGFLKYLDERKIGLENQESLSLKAANSLIMKLRSHLEPFRVIMDDAAPWEERSAVVRLADKVKKSKRNKKWRKRKRQRVAKALAKERERFDQADKEADEWRAREIAKDAAQHQVEKMKEIAKLKAKEERKRLESELELVLIVEKLQELRNIRIQKLKKQGHFLPEEDDKFFERVRAAVEEEEREARAAADTAAAKDAIATAEESRKNIRSQELDPKDTTRNTAGNNEAQNKIDQTEGDKGEESSAVANKESGKQKIEGQSRGGAYDAAANLPDEFYHYYYGSNRDMGTLIEVRRMWDAYIRPGGSRIPGHWVQPPPPADEVWASYLGKPK